MLKTKLFVPSPLVPLMTRLDAPDGTAIAAGSRLSGTDTTLRGVVEGVTTPTYPMSKTDISITPVEFKLKLSAVSTGFAANPSLKQGYGDAFHNQLLHDILYVAWNGFKSAAPQATTLGADLAIDAVTMTVAATTGYPDAGELLVETERIRYTGKTATTFTGLTRGAGGTTAAVHANTTAVGLPSDFPLLMLDGFQALLASTRTGAHLVDGSAVGDGSMAAGQYDAMIAALPGRYLDLDGDAGFHWLMDPATYAARPDGDTPYGYPIVVEDALPKGTIVLGDPSCLLLACSELNTVATATADGVQTTTKDLFLGVGVWDTDAFVLNTGIG